MVRRLVLVGWFGRLVSRKLLQMEWSSGSRWLTLSLVVCFVLISVVGSRRSIHAL